MNVDEILRDISKNMTVFKELKLSSIEENLKSFRSTYWLIMDNAMMNATGRQMTNTEKKEINQVLDLGYIAGYKDALK